MSQVPRAIEPATSLLEKRLMLALSPIIAVLLAVLAFQQPFWTFGIVLGVAVLFSVGKWPEASTMMVFFILYSNAAVVAVEFHGVPYILGISFIGLLAIPLFFYVVVNREKVLVPSTLLLMILFSGVHLAGALAAVHPDLALREAIGTLTEGVLLYFLAINVVRTEATLRRAIWTLVFTGALISLAPIYQQVTGNYGNHLGGFGQVSDAAFAKEVESIQGPVQPRLAGSIGEQNRFAQVMLMLIPLALFRWWGESNYQLRVLAILATMLITLAVVLTFSRGAAIGIVMIVVAMTALRYIRIGYLAFVVLSLGVLLVAIPQYGSRLAKLNGMWALMDSEGGGLDSADGSLKSRITEMGAAGLVFLDHPLIGVGPGMFRYHYREYAEPIGLRVLAKGREAHSLYPGLAAETGVFGTFLFSAIVLITLRDLIRAHRRWNATRPDRANVAATFVLVMVAYLTSAMFLHLAYIRFFWLLMALAHVASRVGNDDARVAVAEPQVST